MIWRRIWLSYPVRFLLWGRATRQVEARHLRTGDRINIGRDLPADYPVVFDHRMPSGYVLLNIGAVEYCVSPDKVYWTSPRRARRYRTRKVKQ